MILYKEPFWGLVIYSKRPLNARECHITIVNVHPPNLALIHISVYKRCTTVQTVTPLKPHCSYLYTVAYILLHYYIPYSSTVLRGKI